MKKNRHLCIHGHFYQPPRENPWLEAIEMQDSAYPYHDWNARITAECYAQNAASRILDEEGKIQNIVNNYSKISFNFGPTLLSWLETNEAETYAAIVDADRESRKRFAGHGSAMAQAFNHMIMPLANRRDKVTQVRWGLRDFKHRFGRPAEGMWLPETAVDLKTLEVLEDEGIQFTILSPYQAKRTRKIDDKEWTDASGGKVDPTMPYRVELPNGRRIAVFFYDGPIARAVAFEQLLNSGEGFAERLMDGFSERSGPQMVNIATDGESYGHHHRFGDMALAHALEYVEQQSLAELTVYGDYLERYPPTWEAEIVDGSSWSCAHGIERWKSDCGCNSGGRPGWHQRWRAPLRSAFDWLRDEVGPLYERHAGELFADPWAAREDYVDLLLDRVPGELDAFLAKHQKGDLDEAERPRAIKLLELQRYAMYMYTSCGWFFDDLSGIETVQVIEYAGRVAQLAQDVFGDNVETRFVEQLEKAESNVPAHGDGRVIYEKWVKPAVLDLKRVAAHYAVSSLFEEYPESLKIYCYEVSQEEGGTATSGRMSLSFGRATVSSLITLEKAQVSFATVHLGDHNIAGGVREYLGREAYEAAAAAIQKAFSSADVPEVIRLFDHHFGDSTFSLRSLFRDEQRKVIQLLLKDTLQTAESAYIQIYDQNAPLMLFLSESNIPVPKALHLAAERALNGRLRDALDQPDLDPDAIESLLAEARERKVALDGPSLNFTFERTVEAVTQAFLEEPTNFERFDAVERAVHLARVLPFEPDLWYVQNLYFRLFKERLPGQRERAVDGDAEARDWVERLERLGENLRMAL